MSSTVHAALMHPTPLPLRPESLLQALIRVQSTYGGIAPEHAEALAGLLRRPVSEVWSVTEFYAFLQRLRPGEPAPRYQVRFSDNITDRLQGSPALRDRLQRRLDSHVERLPPGSVRIVTTSCTGLSDQGPALLVNGRAMGRLDAARIDAIAAQILAGTPVDAWQEDWFTVEANIRRRDLLLQHAATPGQAIARALAQPETVWADLAAAGLRGRGGAGFATAKKWQACAEAPGDGPKAIVCNADEGEPGTFKDRALLAEQADQVFEGMTVAARLIGAGQVTQGFLYLRGEYAFLVPHLEAVLARRRAAGLLGRDLLGAHGFDFDIALHLGAGAYVCGEESALLESLEGKRGIPRNRPPFPVTHGYLGRPTAVNNVETFCAAALIAAQGTEVWRTRGTPDSSGTKLLSVAGDCARPGVYEYPWGIRVREVLADCGAEQAQAVQVGGPSGVCLSAAEFDRRLCFEDLPTAGAFTVFDASRDLFEVARAYADFFAHESCGFCTPCRVGTAFLQRTLNKIAAGRGTAADLAEIEKLDSVLRQAAHCGLGHTACNPTLDTLKRFRPAYTRRLRDADCLPGIDLDAALAPARAATGRDDAAAHLQEGED